MYIVILELVEYVLTLSNFEKMGAAEYLIY